MTSRRATLVKAATWFTISAETNAGPCRAMEAIVREPPLPCDA
jgi:hypothetical protein